MIDPGKLSEKDIGRWVVYDNGFDPPQRGRIKSWGRKTVFVVLKCNGNWEKFMNYTGEGCDPEDLYFEEEYRGEKEYGKEVR